MVGNYSNIRFSVDDRAVSTAGTPIYMWRHIDGTYYFTDRSKIKDYGKIEKIFYTGNVVKDWIEGGAFPDYVKQKEESFSYLTKYMKKSGAIGWTDQGIPKSANIIDTTTINLNSPETSTKQRKAAIFSPRIKYPTNALFGGFYDGLTRFTKNHRYKEEGRWVGDEFEPGNYFDTSVEHRMIEDPSSYIRNGYNDYASREKYALEIRNRDPLNLECFWGFPETGTIYYDSSNNPSPSYAFYGSSSNIDTVTSYGVNPSYKYQAVGGVAGMFNHNGIEYVSSPTYSDKLFYRFSISDVNDDKWAYFRFADNDSKYSDWNTYDKNKFIVTDDIYSYDNSEHAIFIPKNYPPNINIILMPAMWRVTYWTQVIYYCVQFTSDWYESAWFAEGYNNRYPRYPYEYGISSGGFDPTLDEALQMYEEAYADILGPGGLKWTSTQYDLAIEYQIQWSDSVRRMVSEIYGYKSPAGNKVVCTPIYNSYVSYVAWKMPYKKDQLLGIVNVKYPNGLERDHYIIAKDVEVPGGGNAGFIQKAKGQMYWDMLHTNYGVPSIYAG